MSRTLRLLLLLLLAAWVGPLGAMTSLEAARAARARLGPGVWSRIVQIDNTDPQSAYPRQLAALVFEAGGLLWFYTDADGTQSFSRHAGQLEQEKADFAPLLRAIDRGFTRFAVLGELPEPAPGAREAPLPNGCFIDSYAALRELIAHGESVAHARFLLLYFAVGPALHGHALLTYETPHGSFALDAGEPNLPPQSLPARIAHDALAVAREVRPELAITQARWVPAELAYPARL